MESKQRRARPDADCLKRISAVAKSFDAQTSLSVILEAVEEYFEIKAEIDAIPREPLPKSLGQIETLISALRELDAAVGALSPRTRAYLSGRRPNPMYSEIEWPKITTEDLDSESRALAAAADTAIERATNTQSDLVKERLSLGRPANIPVKRLTDSLLFTWSGTMKREAARRTRDSFEPSDWERFVAAMLTAVGDQSDVEWAARCAIEGWVWDRG